MGNNLVLFFAVFCALVAVLDFHLKKYISCGVMALCAVIDILLYMGVFQ